MNYDLIRKPHNWDRYIFYVYTFEEIHGILRENNLLMIPHWDILYLCIQTDHHDIRVKRACKFLKFFYIYCIISITIYLILKKKKMLNKRTHWSCLSKGPAWPHHIQTSGTRVEHLEPIMCTPLHVGPTSLRNTGSLSCHCCGCNAYPKPIRTVQSAPNKWSSKTLDPLQMGPTRQQHVSIQHSYLLFSHFVFFFKKKLN